MAGPENFEDKSFEKAWEEAFDDATQQPNPRVWSNIERDLAYQQMAVLRKRARFYQWTAAAAMFIAAFLGINYFISNQPTDTDMAFAGEDPTQMATNESSNSLSNQQSPGSINEQKIIAVMSDDQEHLGSDRQGGIQSGDNEILMVDLGSQENVSHSEDGFVILSLNDQKIRPEIAYEITPRMDRKMYNKAINAKFAPIENKTDQDKRFWAGVGMGSGSFDPNYQSGSSNLLASSLDLSTAENFAVANSARIVNQSPAVREGMKSGTSIDLGLNFGVRVSDNWIVESGLTYTQSSAITQTNVVVESPNAVEPIAASSETRGVTQLNNIIGAERFIQYDYQDVALDNQFQFATLPVKAGFVLIDSRLNIVVNAGFATNFYLGNRLTDQSNEVASVSIGPGESSPYKEVSFTGLGGLTIGYAIFDQIEITVEPYMRQPITSLTKQGTSFVAAPSGYGLNTGIRYRFN